jgi:hypothetical protein
MRGLMGQNPLLHDVDIKRFFFSIGVDHLDFGAFPYGLGEDGIDRKGAPDELPKAQVEFLGSLIEEIDALFVDIDLDLVGRLSGLRGTFGDFDDAGDEVFHTDNEQVGLLNSFSILQYISLMSNYCMFEILAHDILFP